MHPRALVHACAVNVHPLAGHYNLGIEPELQVLIPNFGLSESTGSGWRHTDSVLTTDFQHRGRMTTLFLSAAIADTGKWFTPVSG